MIEILNMSAGYNGRTVVQTEHLILSRGEIIALVGQNGCGKSTLLRAIAGLLPHRGSIFCNSVEISRLSSRERAGLISFLPQHLTIPEMSVETLVNHGRFCRMGFSRTLTDHDRKIVTNAMVAAEVEHLRDKQISSLSGGERQRAYLAMTIAQESPMMLFDEPDTYMDITHKKALLTSLQNLKHQGRGIVLSCHDLPFAFLAADRVLVMHNGRIVADGSPDEVSSMEDVLYRAMGAGMRKTGEQGFLYPYMISL